MTNNVSLQPNISSNLLNLQNIAAELAQTQQALSTGKKVNSALDNPSSFFTSQNLNTRANDLNSLLDNIGQAQQTISTANQGITSLTTLLQSAKSIIQQAQQAPGPSSVNFGAFTVSSTAQSETLASTGNGAAITVADNTTYSFNVNFGDGSGNHAVSFTSGTGATFASILAGLQASFATAATAAGYTAGTDVQLVANQAGNGIKISALNSAPNASGNSGADINLTIGANSGAGLTNGSYNGTNLLDNIIAAGGSNGGSTLQVSVNGAAAQIITFGTNHAAGQVSTLAGLNAKLASLTGLSSGGVSGNTVSFVVGSSSTQNSLVLTSSAGVATALGNPTASTNGVASVSGANSTRTSLQNDFNSVLTQINQLAADSSYNGINLLNGDTLNIVFNETGTSSLSITGVTDSASGLGLSAASGNDFQVNATLDSQINNINTALTSLQNQASNFGSNLSTVQTRQDFTKNLVNILQAGANNLTLADPNQEAATLLSLQTSQQLSQTALSLANQSNQSVLRLFQ